MDQHKGDSPPTRYQKSFDVAIRVIIEGEHPLEWLSHEMIEERVEERVAGLQYYLPEEKVVRVVGVGAEVKESEPPDQLTAIDRRVQEISSRDLPGLEQRIKVLELWSGGLDQLAQLKGEGHWNEVLSKWHDQAHMQLGAGKDWEQGLIEELAAYAHEAWAGWMKWMLPKLLDDHALPRGINYKQGEPGTEGFRWSDAAQDCLDRWARQVQMQYALLSQEEKESDRKQARQVLDIVRTYLGLLSSAEEQMVGCSHCGHSMSRYDHYCSHCGEPTDEYADEFLKQGKKDLARLADFIMDTFPDEPGRGSKKPGIGPAPDTSESAVDTTIRLLQHLKRLVSPAFQSLKRFYLEKAAEESGHSLDMLLHGAAVTIGALVRKLQTDEVKLSGAELVAAPRPQDVWMRDDEDGGRTIFISKLPLGLTVPQ